MLSSNKSLTFADATCAAIDCRKITWEHFLKISPCFHNVGLTDCNEDCKVMFTLPKLLFRFKISFGFSFKLYNNMTKRSLVLLSFVSIGLPYKISKWKANCFCVFEALSVSRSEVSLFTLTWFLVTGI